MAGLRVVSIAAIIFAVVLRFLWEYVDTTEHCYTSIRTLSDTPVQANCFTTSRAGLIKEVYTKKNPTHTKPGHVLPGLWDGHGHLLQYGEMLHSVDLFQSSSLPDIRDRLVRHMNKNKDQGTRTNWLRGIGWDQAAFGGNMPTAHELEKGALRGKYIMLDRVDVHCVWVSQAVINLIPKPLPTHVDGGDIVFNPGPGVFCDNAIDLVRAVFPAPPPEKKALWLDSAMSSLNSLGIVGVHDAGVPPSDLALYEKKVKLPSWTVRVYAMFECAVRNTFCPRDARKISYKDLLTVRSVKLFSDGALGSWGSAMLEPYTDKPSDTGSLLVNASTLTSLARSWAGAGYQVNIHAIGDLANRNSIDALAAALEVSCAKDDLKSCQQDTARFRIEHAQIIHTSDQRRMHALGLIPSIQPTHATSDMSYAPERLGERRTRYEAYRMASLLPLQPILGSDFPVEPPNPFEGMYAAMTRRSPRTGMGRNGADEGWMVEETLTLKQALEGFTVNPAHSAFLEGKAGVIQPGALADWIVLDEDLMRMSSEEVRKVRVRETWVGGRRVYRRD